MLFGLEKFDSGTGLGIDDLVVVSCGVGSEYFWVTSGGVTTRFLK